MIHQGLSDILNLKRLPLGELGFFYGGLSGKSKEDFESGNSRFIPYMNVFSNLSIDVDNLEVVQINDGERQNKVKYGDILFTGSSETPDECGMSSVMLSDIDEENPIYLNSFCFGYRFNDIEKIVPSFYKHLFRSYKMRERIGKTANGVTRFNISKKTFAKILIPVPSIEQQKEIADKLEAFTTLIEKLNEEIELRKQQFEHYRGLLLNIEGKEGVEMKTIQDVCKKICSGGTPSTSHKEYFDGNIPWLRTQEVDWKDIYDTEIKITEEAIANSSAKLIPANCVIVAMYGATAAKAAINKIPLSTNQACCNLEINDNMALYKYVYHWICKEYQNLKSMGEGSQHNINGQKIKSYLIPIPSLSEQSRIVSILDMFANLISKLEEERDLRQKQYEYYREKLLTFE